MKFVVKLFPEIIVKSKPVRKKLIKQLRTNIRRVLKLVDDDCKVSGDWDRLEVLPSTEDAELIEAVAEHLTRIPGVEHILECDEFTFETVEDIEQIVADNVNEDINHKTFCVRVKRTGRHPFSSIELERKLGGVVLNKCPSAKVKLKQPDITVNIEIVSNRLFWVKNKHQGLGGFPIGMQDAALSLISGGYDSSVSSYLMMRRGVRTHFCFFNLGGSAHEVGVKQVSHYLWDKFGSSHRVLFTTVPFEGVVEEILTKVDNAYMGVILKRMMLRAASAVAKEMNAPALVTGEAIAQVSSQTMINLNVIDSSVDDLVLRPLISMHKQEIIELAQKIGTAGFAASMPEYCGVISNKPTTAAKPHRVIMEEERFDFKVLEKAVEDKVTQPIDQVLVSVKSMADVDIVSAPAIDDIVIDIRHPQEVENNTLFLTNNEVITIPFYALERRYKTLDQNKTYLLYCEKGVMSELQAQHLIQNGYENVKVFR